MEPETKNCQNCQKDFLIESEDLNFYEKMKIPAPTFCAECRFQKRLMFRNDRTLYKRKCDLTGKDMVTFFAPDKNVKVYFNKDWWGDAWEAKDFGQDYDPSKNFFEQFNELQKKTPWPNLIVDSTNINCDYANNTSASKNCYLVFDASRCENVYYSEIIANSRDSMDCTTLNKGELCYDVVDGNGSKIKYSENCDECLDTWFSKDCVGCSNCFGCVNLRKKSYCIWNQQYTKEEYSAKLESFGLDKYSVIEDFKKRSRKFWLKFPRKYYHGRQNTNSSGDYVYYSKNAKNIYQSVYVEDSKNCQFMLAPSAKDCYDISGWGENIELCCDGISVGNNSQNIKFCFLASREANNVEYSMMVPGCQDCFGCCNLKKGQYCILNKQYSKEEYFVLREKIIKDMNERPYVDKLGRVWRYGDFFPYDLSLFDYNESSAFPFFRLSKEEAVEKGFKWNDRSATKYEPTIKSEDLPETVGDMPDSILEEILECTECKKAYRITRGELTLLRKMNIPIPRKCFMCRFYERIGRINPNKLYSRQCQCAGEKSENGEYQNTISHSHGAGRCDTEVETSYAPDRPEIVYCENCYKQEVY
jgi:hypothetical protein